MNARRLAQRNAGIFPTPRMTRDAFPFTSTRIYVPRTRTRRAIEWVKARPDFPVVAGGVFAVAVIVGLIVTGASGVRA